MNEVFLMYIDLIYLLLESLRALSGLQLVSSSLLSLLKYALKEEVNPPKKLKKELLVLHV